MEAFVSVVALVWLGVSIWFVVIGVRFLRSGRKAFDRYVALTDDESRMRLSRGAVTPAPPSAGPGSHTTMGRNY